MIRYLKHFVSLFLCISYLFTNANAATVSENPTLFESMHIDVIGPMADEIDTAPNPFLDIRFDLRLTAPSGRTLTVPGFFAGNGRGAGNGNVWRARFTPDEVGDWQYSVNFLRGTNVAVLDQTDGMETIGQPDDTGSFSITDSESALQPNGRLQYVGEHYLKFSNGPYWIKGGVDSPENFFGYIGFDNTVNQLGGVGEAQLPEGLHHYAEHIADWKDGDPLFSSQDSGVDSKGIIGAVNYLASEGINSMYFLLMNLGGDGRDTYPFIGATGSSFDNTHYDVSKLRQWNIVLEHMQAKGIAAHLVLGEQEEENKTWLDNGELGIERKLYYREMVARFTHLNAVKWNLSEESRYGDAKHKSFGQALRSFDWAQHPIAVHSFVDNPEKAYDALLGNELFNISSIQFSSENADAFTETWREKSTAAGVPWVIDMDEVGPGNIGLTDNNSDQLRREVLYPVYFSGGNIEWYFGFRGADIRTENFRTREPMFRYMRYAREFIEQQLPFWEMNPNDDALVGGDANDQVFAKPGEVYALYLNRGNSEPSLNVVPGDYLLQWFNPRTGELNATTRSVSGDSISIGASPSEPQEDWVVLVQREEAEQNNNESDTSAETQTNTDAGTDTADVNSSTNNNAENSENTSVDANVDENIGGSTEGTTANGTTDTTDNANNPDLAAANETPSGGGYTSVWFLIIGTSIILGKLLLRFRRRCILTTGFNVLSIQCIEVNRVE